MEAVVAAGAGAAEAEVPPKLSRDEMAVGALPAPSAEAILTLMFRAVRITKGIHRSGKGEGGGDGEVGVEWGGWRGGGSTSRYITPHYAT